MAWRAILLTLLAWLALTSSASAQLLQFERYAAQCNDVDGAYTADESINACTQIIRSDYAVGHALAATYNTRAIRYLQKHDDARALSDFSAAIRYSPHYAQAFLNRAALYLVRRDYARAIADYDEAIVILPDHPDPYSARCWARALSGADFDRARADCDRALALNPHSQSAFDSRGFLNLRQSRVAEAFSDYDAAVQIDPSNAHARYGRGIAALRMGRVQDGQADLAAAAQTDARIAQTYAVYGVTP